MSIVFVRHGEKENGPDPVLTGAGFLQAIKSGQNGLNMIKPDDLTEFDCPVSPYKRTLETAILAMAQIEFDPQNPLILKLEPRISETNENSQCWGSDKDDLLAWMDEEFEARMLGAIDFAVEAGEIKQQDAERVKQRVLSLIARLDKKDFLKIDRQDWWPGGKDSVETPSDAFMRVSDLRCETNKPFIAFTHSTTISAVINGLKGSFTQSAANLNRGLAPSDVPYAGVYKLDELGEGYHQMLVFDPAA